MRKIGSAFIGISILSTSIAWAETPLPAGKPAGVRQAQMGSHEYLVFGGIAALGAGIAIATSGGRASNAAAQSVVVSAPATTS
jgi:hypothetical protein